MARYQRIFKRLAEIADSKSLTKEEQEKYDNSMMVMWDNYAVYKHATDKGLKEGMKEGLEKGMKEGLEKGMKEGMKEKAREIALNLLSYNTPVDIISKSTGLLVNEIENLKY